MSKGTPTQKAATGRDAFQWHMLCDRLNLPDTITAAQIAARYENLAANFEMMREAMTDIATVVKADPETQDWPASIVIAVRELAERSDGQGCVDAEKLPF